MNRAAHRWYALLISVLVCALMGMSLSQAQEAAQALRDRYITLDNRLASNPFNRPLVLQSSQYPDGLKGEVYALVEQPFGLVGPLLGDINHWCDILILHQNVKSCRSVNSGAGPTLNLRVGRKFSQPLADAYPFEFLFTVVEAGPDYLQLLLSADEGPLDTSRFRLALEVVSLDVGRSFLHMSYAYAYGATARLAMVGYLATAGRDKVGFSIVGRDSSGQPVYVGGTQGVVERNTMRYYLAIEAYLASLSAPPSEQQEARLKAWHAAIERYPRQLHELELGQYLEMKREELHRQQAAVLK